MLVTNDNSGTAKCLGNIRALEFRVLALSDNTGAVYVDLEPQTEISLDLGTEDVEYEVLNGPVASTKEGLELQPGVERVLEGPELRRWWFDVATSGDSVSITPVKPIGVRWPS